MQLQPTAPVGSTPHRRRRGGPTRASLATPSSADEAAAAARAGEARARTRLAAAAAAGEPLLDANGRPRSLVTLPEYRLGRAAANKGRPFPAEVYTAEEVLAVIDSLPKGPVGVRNGALIAIFWRAGLRCEEALALFPKDILIDGEEAVVTVLLGKGAKRRVVPIDASAAARITAWLEARERLGIDLSRPLFCVLRKDTSDRRAIGGAYVREMLKLYQRKAKVHKRFHPHGLRHTYAVDLANEDIPVNWIRALLGHEDLAMTQHYIDHLNPKDMIRRIAARPWPGGAPAPAAAVTTAALSNGAGAPARTVPPVLRDPPEPPPAATPKPAPYGQAAERVYQAITAAGAVGVTQGQLRRSLGLTCTLLLRYLHILHQQRRIQRAGFDRYRSVIWKVAPPQTVTRHIAAHRRQRRAPNGEGPSRTLDALDALGGRASQAQVARLLDLSPNTIHDHFRELEAAGHVERGGLDKTTSRRGSQIWATRSPSVTWQAAGTTQVRFRLA